MPDEGCLSVVDAAVPFCFEVGPQEAKRSETDNADGRGEASLGLIAEGDGPPGRVSDNGGAHAADRSHGSLLWLREKIARLGHSINSQCWTHRHGVAITRAMQMRMIFQPIICPAR